MSWTLENNKLIGIDGKTFDVLPHALWYLAPARVTYSRGEGVVRPLDFAVVLHNAVMGKGLVTSLNTLLSDLGDPTTEKRGAAAEAELLLESTRRTSYPARPSRLRSYFLNFDRAIAEKRANTMFRGNRCLVQCHLVLNGGTYHFADVDVYERLEGQPDNQKLAHKYWEEFQPTREEEFQRLEILADSALYFPDWRDFPILEDQHLLAWSLDTPLAKDYGRG